MVFNTFFTEMVLPFLLVFVVVFAILEKSKILGSPAKQINSLTALVIGLLCIGVPVARNFITVFMPWLAIGIAVLLVFFVLYGFVAGDLTSEGNKAHMKTLSKWFGILAAVFVVAVLIYVTGFWMTLQNWFGSANTSWATVGLVILVIGGVAWVVFGGGDHSHGEKGK